MIMNITPDLFVKDVVRKNFRTAPLFQAHNIDYCCGGNRPIADACTEAGVDSGKLISELESILALQDPDSEYINRLTPGELCNYIVKRHHAYVMETIPFLKINLDKICQVHGERHPELFKVRDQFYDSAQELSVHMQKEEVMLFPYIKKLDTDHKLKLPHSPSPFGSVSNPIAMMMDEHQFEGNRFQQISELTGNYSIPKDGCTTYEVTLKKLHEFEDDLHRHIHLENNILFPKAIELEDSL
jgi:regulator of cell morphogenesis and NO signaling